MIEIQARSLTEFRAAMAAFDTRLISATFHDQWLARERAMRRGMDQAIAAIPRRVIVAISRGGAA